MPFRFLPGVLRGRLTTSARNVSFFSPGRIHSPPALPVLLENQQILHQSLSSCATIRATHYRLATAKPRPGTPEKLTPGDTGTITTPRQRLTGCRPKVSLRTYPRSSLGQPAEISLPASSLPYGMLSARSTKSNCYRPGPTDWLPAPGDRSVMARSDIRPSRRSAMARTPQRH